MSLKTPLDCALASLGADACALRVAVVVASRGRPRELEELCALLQTQTQPPAQIILSVTAQSDLPELAASWNVEQVLGPAGLCAQRNRGLDRVHDDIQLIAFFDDDYVPRDDALEGCARLFREEPQLAAANGHLVADGINGPGISFAEARQLLADRRIAGGSGYRHAAEALYGCNMVFRAAAVRGLRFDERLPLYGWQEDIDFSSQAGRWGGLVKCDAFVGVHRGVKGARVSGRRFGYSQIVNPAYLARKGTMRGAYAAKIALKNIAMNLARCLAPEPWVDRRGRLEGNLLGLAALARGRGEPERILDV